MKIRNFYSEIEIKFKYKNLLKIIIICFYFFQFSNYSMLSKMKEKDSCSLNLLKLATAGDILKATNSGSYGLVKNIDDLYVIELLLSENKNINFVVEVGSKSYNIKNKQEILLLKSYMSDINNSQNNGQNNSKYIKKCDNEYEKIIVDLGYFHTLTQAEFNDKFMNPKIYNK